MNTDNAGISKYTISFGLSLALASVINALLVAAKEKSPTVMTGLQKMTGHHWVSHAVIVLVFFVAGGLMFARANGGRGMELAANRLLRLVVSSVVLGGLVIAGFYLAAG